MPTVADIVSALAEVTHPEKAAPWDPVGLQIGDPAAAVGRIGVCHEVTEEVVAAVEREPVDLMVSYHPLLFTPITALVAGRSATARAFRLIVAGVALLVTHSDFDSAPGGAADALAGVLGLTDAVPFGDDDVAGLPPIGRVGGFEGTVSALVEIVSGRLGNRGLRVSGDVSVPVAKVAVVPGSGADLIGAAADVSEVLVTGDVSHHRAIAALDLGLAIVDPGHIATERPGVMQLMALVRRTVDIDVVDFTAHDPATW